MDRISVSQISTRNWWLEEDAIRYASLGFRSIAVWRDKLSDYSVDFVSTLFSDLHLKVSSLQWAGGFTGSDGRSFCDAIEDGIDAIRQASQLGTEFLLVHPGDRCFHTRSHAERLLRSALTELVPVSEDFGIRLLLQPMPRNTGKPWTFIHDFDKAIEFCDGFRSGNPGLAMNAFQWADHFDSIIASQDITDRLQLVQISDRSTEDNRQRALLGMGDLPLQTWIKQLIEKGYHGPFEIELFGAGVESVTYVNRLQHTRAFLDHLSRSISIPSIKI